MSEVYYIYLTLTRRSFMTIFSMLSVIVAISGHAAHSSSANLIRPCLDLAAENMTVVNNNTDCRS